MIYESSYWKEPLLETARWLKRLKISDRTQERTFVRIEKEIFVSFYSIRKLIEARKISDSIIKKNVSLFTFPNSLPVNLLNCNRVEDLYDLESKSSVTKNLEFLCNQFIHSYVFSTLEDNGKLAGVFVSSDREKNKFLYLILTKDIVAVLNSVGRDYPANTSYKYNLQKQDYDVSHNLF